MVPAREFAARLNEQIGNEFSAEHQYLACAIYYDRETLPELARFFYRQALEERGHALMMVQYLLDTGTDVELGGVAASRSDFVDAVGPLALALEQEQRVSKQIAALAAVARDAGDYTSEQFMQWFIKEQVEEVATMSSLLQVAERSREDLASLEEFVARERSAGEAADPTAPRAAGTG